MAFRCFKTNINQEGCASCRTETHTDRAFRQSDPKSDDMVGQARRKRSYSFSDLTEICRGLLACPVSHALTSRRQRRRSHGCKYIVYLDGASREGIRASDLALSNSSTSHPNLFALFPRLLLPRAMRSTSSGSMYLSTGPLHLRVYHSFNTASLLSEPSRPRPRQLHHYRRSHSHSLLLLFPLQQPKPNLLWVSQQSGCGVERNDRFSPNTHFLLTHSVSQSVSRLSGDEAQMNEREHTRTTPSQQPPDRPTDRPTDRPIYVPTTGIRRSTSNVFELVPSGRRCAFSLPTSIPTSMVRLLQKPSLMKL